MAANRSVNLRPYLKMEFGDEELDVINNYNIYRSTHQAVGMGPKIAPRTRKAAIQELSSSVIGTGESGAVNLGKDGDVQP